MKKLHTRALGTAAALVLALLLVLPALAAQTADLIVLDEVTDLVVIVQYQTQEPEISFLAPDGTVYIENESDMWVERGSTTVYYHIPRASPGQWQIVYDKKDEQELTIHFAQDVRAVYVTDLAMERTNDSTVRVSFLAEYGEEATCNYIIYAVLLSPDGQISGQRELAHGQGRVDQTIQTNVSLRGLSSYSDYHLMVEVYLESGGIEVSDTAVTQESFAYENSSAPQAMEAVELTVDLEGGTLRADWSRWRPYSCQAYLLALFREGESEPVFFQEYDSTITACDMLIDGLSGPLRVDLTYRRNDTMSRTLSRTVDLEQAGWLEIATPDSTNAAQARVDYRLPQPLTALMEVNGESRTLPLEGEGYFSADIRDGINDLSVSWSPEEHLTFLRRREIFCDRIAPTLRLFQTEGTARTTLDRYLLAGQAELDCALTVGDRSVTLEEDGTFLCELPLTLGENVFQLVLTDRAGNRTVQTLVVERTWPAAGSGEDAPGSPPSGISAALSPVMPWLPLILSAAGGLLFVLLGLLLFRKGKDGKRHVSTTLSVLFWICDILSAAICGWCGWQYLTLSKQVNSSAFLELSQSSLSQAYELLIRYRRLGVIALAAGVAALVLLALNILLITFRSFRKGRETAPQAEKPPKKKDRKKKAKAEEAPPRSDGGGQPPGPDAD